jgi:exonuclease VII large subunit
MATQPATPSSAQPVEKIDRIRDIVFGSQMRDYAQRFEMIGIDLTRVQQELNRMEDVMREQEVKLLQQLQQRTDDLAAQLADLTNRQMQQLQELERRAFRSLQELDQKLVRAQEDLGRTLRNAEDVLRNEYRLSSAALNENKMDRFSLGDLLIEFGKNLKSDVPTPMTAMADLIDQFHNELDIAAPNSGQEQK